jgi:hypothetical protein
LRRHRDGYSPARKTSGGLKHLSADGPFELTGMKPWPDAPQNAGLEDCLRSPDGDVAVPFKTNSCGQPKTSPQPLRAQN